MIYRDIPKNFNLDINTFRLELDYYLNNLPDQEKVRLNQYNNCGVCKMYHNYIYRSTEAFNYFSDPTKRKSIQNFDIHTPEKNFLLYKKVISEMIDTNFYDYSSLNFFNNTIAIAKSNPCITNIILVHIKPSGVVTKHVHENKEEYIIHTLLEDMGEGHLYVCSTNSKIPTANEEITISKSGDQFRHEAIIPHGGSVSSNGRPAFFLSVAFNEA